MVVGPWPNNHSTKKKAPTTKVVGALKSLQSENAANAFPDIVDLVHAHVISSACFTQRSFQILRGTIQITLQLSWST